MWNINMHKKLFGVTHTKTPNASQQATPLQLKFTQQHS